jgi:hypothetical protein
MAAPGPQRKNKQMLTLIPEQERSIDYRFEFTIVGEGAKSFAEAAVSSEMAEAYHPAKAKMDEIQEHEEEPKEEHHEVHGLELPAKGNTDGGKEHSEKNKLVMFCPIGEGTKAIARIRFTVVEQFSDSLPLTRDAQVALNQAVIFLYYPNGVGEAARCNKSSPPMDEFRSDFISRFAEINHTPAQFRPHCRIVCFEVEPEDEEALIQLGATKKVNVDSQPDHAEDIVMDCLQGICDHLIQRQVNGRSEGQEDEPLVAQADKTSAPPKSSCCVLL